MEKPYEIGGINQQETRSFEAVELALPSFRANELAPSTSDSAPKMTIARPRTVKKTCKIIMLEVIHF